MRGGTAKLAAARGGRNNLIGLKLPQLSEYPKADVIERRRLIRNERIIAVALAHDDFLDETPDQAYFNRLPQSVAA